MSHIMYQEPTWSKPRDLGDMNLNMAVTDAIDGCLTRVEFDRKNERFVIWYFDNMFAVEKVVWIWEEET